MADTTTTQIVAESPLLEQQKLQLLEAARNQVQAAANAAQQGIYLTPDYRIAGMSQDQLDAIEAGRAGIGAYQPYLTRATQTYMDALGTTGGALKTLAGADTRRYFPAAQEAMTRAGEPLAKMGQSAQDVMRGQGLIGEGAGQLATAQQMAQQYQQANLAPSQALLNQSVAQMQGAGPEFSEAAARARAASQLGIAPLLNYNPDLTTYQMGPADRVRTLSFAQPEGAEAYMSPYMQSVVQRQQQAAQREADIQSQAQKAQFAQAGAFGGGRFGVQQARMAEALARQKGDIQAQGLQTAYQQAQQQFNAEQAARLQAQMANQQAGLTTGQQNLAAALGVQQLGAQQGMQAALANQAMRGQYGLAGAQYGLQGAAQLGSLEAQRAQAAQQAAQYMGTVGQALGQQGLQQAQLGQAAAGQLGALGAQRAGLASLYGQLAGQQANIYGQQSQLGQQLGQGIGALAGQEFGIGQQLAQSMGALGAQQGSLAGQIGNLGAQQQAMGQQDVNFLYNLGAQQQRQTQAQLDAERQNVLQQNLQPYQQLGFLSDIYKGAPTGQMAITTQSAPTASPFQQIAGLGIAGASAAAAGAKAGLF